ncbi:MAG: hypothetical protein WCD31_08390 [Gillisia sp.]
MKIIATTLGETTGDLLSMTLNIGYLISLVITFGIFVVVLFIQLKNRKFSPYLYWLVIVATTTLGTEISDFMDRTLGLGYAWGALILFICLMLVLLIWYKKEGELKIYPIYNMRVEIYYWIAILFSNSLGTAFGDYLSDNIGLSYFTGALVTGAIILVVVLLHYFTKLNQILLFWIAFIFTRPFGATFGDLLTKPGAKGGMHFGTGLASIIAAGLLLILIIVTHKKKINSHNQEKVS